jgi:acetyl esterase/lipase
VITLSYGDDPIQFAELTVPEGEPEGTVVYFHGGFWRARYDLSLGRPIAVSLAQHGWATLNVEYRRNDLGGGFPETFDDVVDAFALLAGTGLESGPVVAMGHSAGGHLAAWAASQAQHPGTSAWGEPRVSPTHLITLGAVLDLAEAVSDGLGDGAVERFMGGEIDERYALADPARHVPLAIPVWCVHGKADDIVPFTQSEDFVARSIAAGGIAQLVPVEGDHFIVVDTGSPSWAATLEILATLER